MKEDLKKFLERSNINLPVRLQESFTACVAACFQDGQKAALEAGNVVETLQEVIFGAINPDWVHFACLSSTALSDACTFVDDAKDVFGETQRLLDFLQLRGKYMIELFSNLVQLNDIKIKYPASCAALLEGAASRLAMADAVVAGCALEWSKLWSSILEATAKGKHALDESLAQLEAPPQPATTKEEINDPQGATAITGAALAVPTSEHTLESLYNFTGPGDASTLSFSLGAQKLESHVDIVFIKRLAVQMEAWMWKEYHQILNKTKAHVTFDLQKKPIVVCLREAPHGLQLVFCGPIGFLPSKNSLKVASVFNVDFYMSGAGVDSVMSDCMVPAWCAKTVSTNPSMEKAVLEKNYYLDAYCEILKDPPTFLSMNYIPLKLYYHFLTPLADFQMVAESVPVTYIAESTTKGKRGAPSVESPFGGKSFVAAMSGASVGTPREKAQNRAKPPKHLLK